MAFIPITSDITPASGAGYTYVNDNDIVQVAAGVLVQSIDYAAVFSSRSGSVLINSGTLSRANAGSGILTQAVYFQSGGAITNEASGLMSGAVGVFTDNAPTTVTNYGAIWGLKAYGVLMRTIGGTDTFKNYGDVYGLQAGVWQFSSSTTSPGAYVCENHGSIRSDAYGIRVSGAVDHLTTITNVAGAEIKGATAAVMTENNGHIVLTNKGTITGGIDANAIGNDTIVNQGKIVGDVLLGPGNDIFKGTGGGAIQVYGEAGNDTLIGSSKADRLNGGVGKDTMSGKLGADFFDFDTTADSAVGAQRDFIADFTHAQHDRIDLSTIDAKPIAGDQAFSFRGTQAFNGAGQIRYVLHDKPGTANDTTSIYGKGGVADRAAVVASLGRRSRTRRARMSTPTSPPISRSR